MNKTDIEYLDYTWNPIAMRCTPISEGCEHCWHIKMCNRLAANPKLDEARRSCYAGGAPGLLYDELGAPGRLRKPSRIGVQFMGDLFHAKIPNKWVREMLFIMSGPGRRHTYLILTKRADAMETFFRRFAPDYWPLPNVWLGVTVDSNIHRWRIDYLMKIKAAVRWVSMEPLLDGESTILGHLCLGHSGCEDWGLCHGKDRAVCIFNYPPYHGLLDWVTLGGETGSGARPLHPDWVREIRDECIESGTPFFFKHWGEWIVPEDGAQSCKVCGCTQNNACDGGCSWVRPDLCSSCIGLDIPRGSRPVKYRWVGKKTAGRLLDGRTWDQIPEVHMREERKMIGGFIK